MKHLLHIAFAIAALCVYNNSQSQSTSTTGLSIVEVDFTKKSTSVKIPFDIPFTLKIINLPGTVKQVSVAVSERNGNIIVPEAPQTLNGLTSIEFVIPGCSPAKQYDFSIKASAPGPLTPAQFSSLKTALTREANISAALQLLAARAQAEQKARAAGGPVPSYATILANSKTQLVAYFKEAVKQIDPNYIWKEIDIIPPLENLLQFCKSHIDLMDKVTTLRAAPLVTGDSNAAQIITALNTFTADLAMSNWSQIEKTPGNADYDKLVNDVSNIEKAFHTPPTGVSQGVIRGLINYADDAIDGKTAFMDAVINNIILPNVEYFTVTPVLIELDFVTNARLFITLDAGIAGYAARIDRYISYTGFNIYFREVNKQTPLRYYTGWDRIAATTSFLIGLTLSSIEKPNVRKGFIGDKALVIGVGNRLWRFARFNVGALVHYRYDTSPVFNADRYHTSLSPFVSFSVDIGLKEIFSGVFTGIFNNQ
ncbi:hypothetical protein HNQ91_002011 [Filimonas zeae]|uniref:Uncharacterized protein n=1 Tax=Filimonas zeae TaxID=1737353 RepID=A0A917IWC4_9BACT|nr:hypothetical protein [Filimonas zeae]MDR6338960.1 hypothetical protein [Filimonas zeae]GGH65767.1 hypothetical protein GCM10011379_19260 [Filimonas zeae]